MLLQTKKKQQLNYKGTDIVNTNYQYKLFNFTGESPAKLWRPFCYCPLQWTYCKLPGTMISLIFLVSSKICGQGVFHNAAKKLYCTILRSHTATE
jgi:hypothetical protein